MKVPYLINQSGFVLITVVFYTILLIQLQKGLRLSNFAKKRKSKIFTTTVFSLAAWAVVIFLLSLIGFITDFSTFPPKIVIVLVVPLIAIVWVVNTTTIKEILNHVRQELLILLQTFHYPCDSYL